MNLTEKEWHSIRTAVQHVEILNLSNLAHATGISDYRIRKAFKDYQDKSLFQPLILRQIGAKRAKEQRSEFARSLYLDSGLTWVEVGEVFGVSKQRALQIAQEYDHGKMLAQASVDKAADRAVKKVQAIALWSQRWTQAAIAEHLNIPQGTVARWIADARRKTNRPLRSSHA